MIGLLLFLFVVIMVTPYGLIGRGNVVSFKPPRAKTQYQPKCHVRGVWVGLTPSYKMICYQCDDDQRSIIIYSAGTPLDAADVNSCQHYDVAGSVTIIDKGVVFDHKVEFDMSSKKCVLVYYGKTRESDGPCYDYRSQPKIAIGYYNGWKLVKQPWTTGVVREIYSTYYETKDCKSIRGWKSAMKPLAMICYKCDADFVVKIFDDGVPMARATVGTCRSPDVENSIGIVYPKRRTPTTVGIQYKLYTDKCIHKTYTWKVKGLEIVDKDICVYQSHYNTALIRGYRNGWRIERIAK